MRPETRQRLYYYAGMVLVLWVAFGLRLIFIADLPPGLHYDMGRVAERIWRWEAGYGLRLHFLDIAEPFDVLARGLFHRLSGGYVQYMGQVYTVWLYVLATAATGACARVLYSKHAQRDVISFGAALTMATLPPAVQLSLHFYRANSLPLTSMLALTLLIIAWRRHDWRLSTLTGLTLSTATMVYLAGLFVPIGLGLAALIEWVRDKEPLKRIQQGMIIATSFAVMMLPWVYYYWRIPGWLDRVESLSDSASPLAEPSLLPAYLWTTISTIFVPDALHDMRYGPYTTGFLNPALIGLFAIGIGVTIWRWRQRWIFAPLLLGAVMLLPNALSSEPYQPVRMVGTFGALALLVGLGAGTMVAWAEKQTLFRRGVLGLLSVIAISTPLYTGYHVWFHYYEQPRITVAYEADSLALHYRVGYRDLLVQIAESEMPTYVPLVHLNTDIAAAVLRPQYFPTVIPYDGRDLPAGQVVLPRSDVTYGFFNYDLYAPVQYGLLLPETGEILILPPLTLTSAETLFTDIYAQAPIYTNTDGWELGYRDVITEGENPFDDVTMPDTDAVLAIFDDRLELVSIDAPETLPTGDYMPVTLYWRVREAGVPDYFSRLQVWGTDNLSVGREETALSVIGSADFPLNIHYNIYPTVMWQAGEIVPDTRWVRVADEVSAGAYRFAVSVYGYPGLYAVGNTEPAVDVWSLVGRSVVQTDDSPYLVAANPPDSDVFLGDLYELADYALSQDVATLTVGETFMVDVTWYVHDITEVDYITAVHVLDGTGALVAQQDVRGYGGAFPTWAWQAGNTVTLSYMLTLPENAEGPFTVQTLMYDFGTLERLSATEDGVSLANDVIVLE